MNRMWVSWAADNPGGLRGPIDRNRTGPNIVSLFLNPTPIVAAHLNHSHPGISTHPANPDNPLNGRAVAEAARPSAKRPMPRLKRFGLMAVGVALAFFISSLLQPTMLQPGTIAPAFTAPAVSAETPDGQAISLDSFKGKWLALCFYPADFTPACTKQACSLRDNYAELAALGVTVLGISSDTAAEHRKFVEKYTLPYTLVTDDGSIRKAYSVPRSFLGLMPGRVTYVVDPAGMIKGAFDSQLNIGGHIKAIRRMVTGAEQ